jgi:AraC-like DNA-binding protein
MVKPMTDNKQIIQDSLSYHIDWCLHGDCEAWSQDWCAMPSLDILFTPNQLFRSSIKTTDGVQVYEARNGEALLVPAGVLRKIQTDACETRGISIRYTLFGGIDLLSFYRLPFHVSASHSDDIRAIIESLVQVTAADDPLDMSLAAKEHQLAYTLLCKILQLSSRIPEGDKRLLALKRLQGVLEYIDENLETKISVATLANICHLSPHRFNSLFKDIMGCPPHQYLLKTRLQKAMHLLSSSNAPISDIAKRLGFFDQPHFSRLFKTATGLTPSKYRKEIERRLSVKAG